MAHEPSVTKNNLIQSGIVQSQQERLYRPKSYREMEEQVRRIQNYIGKEEGEISGRIISSPNNIRVANAIASDIANRGKSSIEGNFPETAADVRRYMTLNKRNIVVSEYLKKQKPQLEDEEYTPIDVLFGIPKPSAKELSAARKRNARKLNQKVRTRK